MPDLMHGEPDGGQTQEPEDEKTDKILGVGARVGDTVGDVGVARPDSFDHNGDTFT